MRCRTLHVMELHLSPETEAKLNALAHRTHRGTDELLGEAVDYLVEYNEWFERKVNNSSETAQSRTIANDEVALWLREREHR